MNQSGVVTHDNDIIYIFFFGSAKIYIYISKYQRYNDYIEIQSIGSINQTNNSLDGNQKLGSNSVI